MPHISDLWNFKSARMERDSSAGTSPLHPDGVIKGNRAHKLSVLFASEQQKLQVGNSSFRYQPPKLPATQPRAPKASDGLFLSRSTSTDNLLDSAPRQQVIHSVAVLQLSCFDTSGTSKSFGSAGLAILETISNNTKLVRIVAYDASRRPFFNNVITEDFHCMPKPDCWVTFEVRDKTWNALFCSSEEWLVFAKVLVLARSVVARSGNSSSWGVVTQDVISLPDFGQGLDYGDMVQVIYKAWIEKPEQPGVLGQIFQETAGKGKKLELGSGKIVSGLEQGIRGMQKNARRLLVVSPELGYLSATNRPHGIPADATLYYDVTISRVRKHRKLVEVESSLHSTELSDEEHTHDRMSSGLEQKTTIENSDLDVFDQSIETNRGEQLEEKNGTGVKDSLIDRMARLSRIGSAMSLHLVHPKGQQEPAHGLSDDKKPAFAEDDLTCRTITSSALTSNAGDDGMLDTQLRCSLERADPNIKISDESKFHVDSKPGSGSPSTRNLEQNDSAPCLDADLRAGTRADNFVDSRQTRPTEPQQTSSESNKPQPPSVPLNPVVTSYSRFPSITAPVPDAVAGSYPAFPGVSTSLPLSPGLAPSFAHALPGQPFQSYLGYPNGLLSWPPWYPQFGIPYGAQALESRNDRIFEILQSIQQSQGSITTSIQNLSVKVEKLSELVEQHSNSVDMLRSNEMRAGATEESEDEDLKVDSLVESVALMLAENRELKRRIALSKEKAQQATVVNKEEAELVLHRGASGTGIEQLLSFTNCRKEDYGAARLTMTGIAEPSVTRDMHIENVEGDLNAAIEGTCFHKLEQSQDDLGVQPTLGPMAQQVNLRLEAVSVQQAFESSPHFTPQLDIARLHKLEQLMGQPVKSHLEAVTSESSLPFVPQLEITRLMVDDIKTFMSGVYSDIAKGLEASSSNNPNLAVVCQKLRDATCAISTIIHDKYQLLNNSSPTFTPVPATDQEGDSPQPAEMQHEHGLSLPDKMCIETLDSADGAGISYDVLLESLAEDSEALKNSAMKVCGQEKRYFEEDVISGDFVGTIIRAGILEEGKLITDDSKLLMDREVLFSSGVDDDDAEIP